MKRIMIVLVSCGVASLSSFAVNAESMSWTLDKSTGQFVVEVDGSLPLENVLKRLSTEMDFELELGQPNYGDVSGKYSGEMHQVINKLVKPASVFISGSNSPPYKVTRLVLLPIGDEQSKHLPKGGKGSSMMSGGVYTGPEHNREKFERKAQRGY